MEAGTEVGIATEGSGGTRLQLTADARELLALRRQMEELQASAAFAAYTATLMKSVDIWTELATSPSMGHDGMVKAEFYKGTLYGIRLILDLPSRIIREAQDLLRRQENEVGRRTDFTKPGQSIEPKSGVDERSSDIAAELDVSAVGPDARVTADSDA